MVRNDTGSLLKRLETVLTTTCVSAWRAGSSVSNARKEYGLQPTAFRSPPIFTGSRDFG